MSPVRLNGSTSGYSELSAPAVAGNNSIALPTGNGSAYQVLRNGATAGSLEYADKIVSGTAQNSTSGTAIDFTGIPSWVKRVTVMLDGVSTNGTSNVLIQIGDSGGIEITGYVSSSLTTGTADGETIGFQLTNGYIASDVRSGSVIISALNASTNIWASSGCISNGTTISVSAGSKTLSATLDRVRITTVNGTDTFDAGSINIIYE